MQLIPTRTPSVETTVCRVNSHIYRVNSDSSLLKSCCRELPLHLKDQALCVWLGGQSVYGPSIPLPWEAHILAQERVDRNPAERAAGS